ncbi:defensin-like protein 1 [Citrus sinensis]|uniref:defensin-like protein 1 n=1 Tax=Citrus clementina TaxID=85681 RepID=UPI000CECFFA0|nr:defensin-like protein 1 [Citrus x clementina]XP_052300391.1 defensin-like protein 1 [Citrus sinensis]
MRHREGESTIRGTVRESRRSEQRVVWENWLTEARLCESQSHRFHGTCVRSHNCDLVCRTEGFTGGRCRGFRRRCFCTRIC